MHIDTDRKNCDELCTATVAVIIPTFNAGKHFVRCLHPLKASPINPRIIVIDSSSTDETLQLAVEMGAEVISINKEEFNHGATRQMALKYCPDAAIVVYMTQDAILVSPDSLNNIILPFEDVKVGVVCGRQLYHADASPFAAHARIFNYPDVSCIKTKNDISKYGIKTAFNSNSFAAYRCSALDEVGGFPLCVISSEDTYVAAKMLQAGWHMYYAADAICYHSHNFNAMEKFRRYFDIGVFHSRESWYLAMLGKADGEGKKFVFSEIRYLFENAPWLIPSAVIRTGMKLFGYKMGLREKLMPLWLKRKLSMNKGYWENEAVQGC